MEDGKKIFIHLGVQKTSTTFLKKKINVTLIEKKNKILNPDYF